MESEIGFRTKFDKIIEILLYLAHQRRDTDHYCASKYVYLADIEHFKRFGRPITFDQFGAMQWGPVALRTYELLKREPQAMRRANIDDLPFETNLVGNRILIGRPSRDVDLNSLSESDISVFNEILDKYGNLPGPQLHAITKQHFAYRNAWENRPEGRELDYMRYEDIIPDDDPLKEQKIEELKFISNKM